MRTWKPVKIWCQNYIWHYRKHMKCTFQSIGSEGRIMSKEEKIELSFTDDIGYTSFSVYRTWYEKQHLTDAEKLYHLACADDESDLIDCTGKYYE